ncbi:MAG: hypothetical protein GF310_04495 [candidate division Zixibacteria bacterium]|nr:hypothetical protein [candidate division Zixibacteria bacterium]
MRAMLIPAIICLVIFWPSSDCSADVDVGLSIGDDGLKSFYLAIGDHYRAPEKEIIIVRRSKIPEEEMPVVFFLARKVDVSPEVVLKMRLLGKSWWHITTHFGLNAGIYYVPVKGNPLPPYGKAYGHYKNKKKSQWGKIVLSDVDIINFVNLRFISEHWGYEPEEVIKMRARGGNFVSINARVKHKKEKAEKYADDEKPGKSIAKKK